MKRLYFFAFVVSLGAAACGASFTAPPSVRGEVPLIVANQTETALCSFVMGPVDATTGREEWVGRIKPQPGSSTKFSVKPGTYFVSVKGCSDSFVAGVPNVTVAGPTNLVLRPINRAAPPAYRHLETVAGYTSVPVPVLYTLAYLHPPVPTYSGGAAAGEPAQEEAEPEHTSDDPYEGRTDCIHKGGIEGSGRCCSPGRSCDGNNVCTCL